MEDQAEGLNRFASELRVVCEEHVLREKWLLAPTLRVGFQWLDRVARSGRPVFNVRVKTLLHLALELAQPEMVARGTEYLRGAREEVLVDRVFGRLQEAGSGYLGGLEPGPGLTRVLQASIRDLRLAGVTAGKLREQDFEAQDKGRDVGILLSAYEEELEKGRLLDYAGLVQAALRTLNRDPASLPQGTLVLLSEEMEEDLTGLEKALWDAVPGAARRVLRSDRPAGPPDGPHSDAALLAWIREPAKAPPASGDGTAHLFRAVGEVNEIREVFRRCAEEGISLDQVEVLYTDRETYVPLIYERAWNLGVEDPESLPVTFAEGLPPRYSRPGRALAGWLAWIRENYPQNVLLWMIRDGLFRLDEAEQAGSGSARVGEVFRTLPIGEGKNHYLPVLDRKIRALEARLRKQGEDGFPALGGVECRDEAPRGDAQAALLREVGCLKAIRTLVSDLLLWAPAGGGGARQKGLLEGTALLLERRVRRVNKFDEYCHEQLVKKIRELSACLGGEEVKGLDAALWLAELPLSSHVGGLGPRPGCLHAAPLGLGGHAGRKVTFIVGMDDGRFPGGGLQDPLLLDAERRRISGNLPLAAGRIEKKAQELARLLARLRGTVTLSCSCRSLSDDRDLFPSPLLLSAYRILSGNREGVLEDMARDLPVPASFAPDAADRCLDPSEWWLWRTCAGDPLERPDRVIAENFPHLGRGITARLAREGDLFTEYDGHVPEAAADTDPAGPGGPVLSASRLETLGACPLDYFFRYVLEIEPPEEYRVDPQVWLEPDERGELLHEVFRRFLSRLPPADPVPRFDRHEAVLAGILEEEIERWKGLKPPLNPEAFDREARELRQTARIFLMEEEAFCRESTPRYFEVAVGLPPMGEGSPLDTVEPVRVRLPGNRNVRVRGRIDRLDELPGGQPDRFAVWDYKTGSHWKYTVGGREKNPDPFDQGRVVQNVLYMALAQARLRDTILPGAVVERFGYFFPGIQLHGERISWTARELARGSEVLAGLCRMLETGCFPFTDAVRDVRFSPYLAAHGDVNEAAAASGRKIANPENLALEPFRKLRAGAKEAEEER